MNPLKMLRRKATENDEAVAALTAEVEGLRAMCASTLQAVSLLVESESNGVNAMGAGMARQVEGIHERVIEALVQAGDNGISRARLASFADRFGGDGLRTAPLVLARLLTSGVASMSASGVVVARPDWLAKRSSTDAARRVQITPRGPSAAERVAQARADQERALLVEYGPEVIHLAHVLGISAKAFRASFLIASGERVRPGTQVVRCYACGQSGEPFAKWNEVKEVVIQHATTCDYVAMRAAQAEQAEPEMV